VVLISDGIPPRATETIHPQTGSRRTNDPNQVLT